MIKKRIIIYYLMLLIFLLPTILAGRVFTLNECIDMAIRNNPSVRMSRENISIYQAQNLMSYSEILPYISATSSVTRSSPVFFSSDPYRDSYSTNISLSQTVFDLSTIFDIRSSNIRVKESIVSFESAIREIELLVAVGFYDYLKKNRLLSVKELGFRESDENLKKSQLMYDVGILSKVDLLRAEVVKNQSELDLLQAVKDVELSKANLAYLIGFDPSLEFETSEDSVEVESYSVNDYEELFGRVTENNPEVINERLSVSRGKVQLLSSYCNFLPRLSISGSYRYSGDKFTLSREDWDKNDSWSVNASISVPLFTGFSRAANVKQARASLRSEELGLDDTIAKKGIELKRALLSIDEAHKISALAKKNLEKAEESYRMMQEKYNLGAATIIELIDAEEDYELAQVTEISSYYDFLLATFYVTNLLGENIVY